MPHFAEIDPETNIVSRVLVAEDKDWCKNTFNGTWVQTYKKTEGKNYAGIGFTYHSELENFSEPQPYPSWTLDDNCHWQPPVARPTDNKFYTWNEETQTWDETPTP